jgi:dipeptidyl aminopeptidase/acylaminoacyl peptidase
VGVKERLLALTAAALAAVCLGGGAPQAASTLPAALAFSRAETAGGGIFVWERNGRVRLFARTGSAPAWSPDGRRIAYAATAELGATDLYVADADGSHRAPLTRSETADESSPDWAPDGRSLVVERDGTLVVVRADGALERVLTAGREPAWSRSGKIAFVSDRSGSEELYVIDSTGRGLRRLTTSPAAESAPSWSPDGRRLAFVSADGLAVDLYVLDVAGGSVTQLTTDPFTEGSPAWSADGRAIAFVSNRSGVEAPWSIASTGGPAAELPGVRGIERLRWRPASSPELRPDLEQQAPSELELKTVTAGDRKRFLLGFRSATDNVGEGPLSVFAFRQSPVVPTMRASQRVRLIGGGIRTYPRVGFLRYTYSASHDHWHLLGFQRYELRRGDDHRLVVRDRKSGFCLTDRWGNAAPGFVGHRPRPVFTDYCERSNTGALIVSQGTTVGYSDVYPAHYHGQNLDVTRVPAGTYVLVHRASPNLLIRELRYENNAASLRIRLSWPQGRSQEPAVRVLARCPATERCPG